MIIDFYAHCGSNAAWVLKQVQHDVGDANEVLRLAKASGIDRTVVAEMACAFGETENAREPLLDGLVRFASIGPAFDLGRLEQEPAIKGIRIYPTYQEWGFDSPQTAKLLILAGDRGWIVQVCLRLQDPRVLPQAVASGAVIGSLDKLVESRPSAQFVISGANYAEIKANPAPFARGNVWTDISHLQHPINSLPKLLDIVDSSRVLFGSNSPIFYPQMAVFRVIHSPITDEDRERILWKNAQQLLGGVQ